MKQKKLLTKKHKKFCKALKHIEHLVILASTVTRCISISAMDSLVYIPVGNASLAVEINICAITSAIKKFILMIKRKKKKHDKILTSKQ